MTYKRTVWKNREVEKPRTFTIQDNEDGTITLISAEGEILEPGTPIIAANMNNIEEGILYALENAGKVKSVNGKIGEVEIDVGDISGLRNNMLALGLSARAATDGVALGLNSYSQQTGSISIGRNSTAGSVYSIGIGNEANVNGTYSIGIGNKANVNGNQSISLGTLTKSPSARSVAIGYQAEANRDDNIAIGRASKSNGIYSVAIGPFAESGQSSISLGRAATAYNVGEGTLGTTSPVGGPSAWRVPGSFTVNGTKNFEIPHPKPSKKATHVIRHGAVESPTAGDTLYRYKIKSTKENDMQIIDLPDYFVHLNKDVQIFVTPQNHFGNGYGVLNRETEQLEIHCQNEGGYNVLVIGTRNDDHQSVQDWDIKGVEREIGESWDGETYVFEVDEIMEIEEIKEEI